jgi:pimeloyl-ACP methyl ester carboxylesterase
MPRIIKIGIFVFLLVVLMSSSVRASEYFHDDFSSDLSKWDMSIGDTSWTIQNNQLVGQVRRGESSYIYAKNTFSLSDFIFTALVRNEGGIDQHFLFRVSPDKSSFYIIELRYGDEYWPQDGNSIRIWRFKNGSYTLLMPDVPYSMVQDITHFLKIVFIGHNIKVEIDNNLLVNIDDNSNSALLSGGFGLQNYAGDYWFRPVKNIFDDIDISGESVGGLHKIIIIPGLGGSWNTRAMVYGETVGDDRWQMTPFATNYDNLISALEDKGKVRDQDFFVWNYDWRPQVATIVSKLDNFIEQKVESNEKVDLVGHSLGGLVARIWGEENSSDSRLGKVISLGSPHQGAVKAYDAWAGADIADKPDMASIALNVLLTLQMKNYGSRVNTVRGFVPSIRDLLPVFDFTKKNGTALGFESMTTVNNYLVSKNLGAAAVFGDLRAMVGSGFNTKRWINLGENSVFDKVLGRWPDGKPINYLTDDGDGTVLISS